MTDTAAAMRRPARPWRGRVTRAAGYVATVLVVLALWALVTDAGWVSLQTLPTLTEVATALRSLAADGQVGVNLTSTTIRILLSFAAGVIFGIPLGALLWRFPILGEIVRPYLSASYSVPLVVFYPFFLVVLGLNDWPVVVLTSVMTMIPVALNTQLGLRTAPRVLLNVGRSLERTPWQIFCQIRFPAAWPDILAGLKLSMVYAVVGVVSLEFIAAQVGLGTRIQFYYDTFEVPSMYAFILLTLVLAGLCVGMVLAVEALTMRGRR